MKLSNDAILACANKYGRGKLIGFEDTKANVMDVLEGSGIQSVFNELSENEMIFSDHDNIHISALGQHILNMIISPELFIHIVNKQIESDLKLYIRNGYYLCILDEHNSFDDIHKNNLVELLPTLNEVVSAFVYLIHLEDGIELATQNYEKNYDVDDLTITAMVWDEDRELLSDLWICGKYSHKGISYKTNDISFTDTGLLPIYESEISDFINLLTLWLFDKLSLVMER